MPGGKEEGREGGREGGRKKEEREEFMEISSPSGFMSLSFMPLFCSQDLATLTTTRWKFLESFKDVNA